MQKGDLMGKNKSIFNTKYEETLARFLLKLKIPELGTFELKDRPDLQDYNRSIGIEVTNAINEDDVECINISNIYEGKTRGEIPKTLIRKFNISIVEEKIKENKEKIRKKNPNTVCLDDKEKISGFCTVREYQYEELSNDKRNDLLIKTVNRK